MKLTDIARSIQIRIAVLRRAAARGLARRPPVQREAADNGSFWHEPEATARSPGRALITPRVAGGVIGGLLALGLLYQVGVAIYQDPPLKTVAAGDIALRSNRFTGTSEQFAEGSVLVMPGIHELRTLTLRDQVYRPTQSASASGSEPFQSVEGLSVGVDISVRYALDPARVSSIARGLPQDIGGAIVQPAVQGLIYKTFARYTVREIFSSKRAEIQSQLEAELAPRLAADGILLRGVQIGKVDLPGDYRRGMEKLLAEELETEKMRYTLELKAKQVEATALDADAEKVRRQKTAEAAANEQVIAARAQEEAMRHVLPFKQKQIEQRQLEAEAEKVARIRTAEGSAQARRIEAEGEADSRRKLADAEAYRQDNLGKIASAQMARDGALISKHPLLIQKAMAEKLSDKIQVIIAPPSSSGMITAALLGRPAPSTQPQRDGEDGEGSNDKGAE